MGQFSMEISRVGGSALSGNQQTEATSLSDIGSISSLTQLHSSNLAPSLSRFDEFVCSGVKRPLMFVSYASASKRKTQASGKRRNIG
jgi:hypothetical protein